MDGSGLDASTADSSVEPTGSAAGTAESVAVIGGHTTGVALASTSASPPLPPSSNVQGLANPCSAVDLADLTDHSTADLSWQSPLLSMVGLTATLAVVATFVSTVAMVIGNEIRFDDVRHDHMGGRLFPPLPTRVISSISSHGQVGRLDYVTLSQDEE